METARQVGNIDQDHVEKPQFTVVETDRNALYLSLSQAARVWHKHKGTISRHVKDGKLQWHEMPDGDRRLYAPEIAHLYGAPPDGSDEGAARIETAVVERPMESTVTASGPSPMHALLEAKDEMIHMLQVQLYREREISEQWRREFSSIKDHVLALPAPASRDKAAKTWWPFAKKG